MAKQRYRLQPVLNVRERAEQEAARRVAARRAQLALAESELAKREQAVEDAQARQASAQAKMLEEVKPGAPVSQLVAHRAHLSDLRLLEEELKGRVEEQRAVVARAEQELEQALSALVEAAKEVRVIEKHREEWQHRTRRDELRGEQKLIDEIGSLLHARQRRDDEGR